MNINISRSLPIAALASLAVAQPATAATTSSNFPVSATISSTCSLSASGIAFGEVLTSGTTTGQTDGAGTITVTCTSGGAYTVALGNGLHAAAAQRNLQSGSNTLAYDLYQDEARGTVWTGATAPLAGTGTAAAQTIDVYGRIAAGLPLASGNGTPYTDTVLVTLTY